MGAGAGAGWVRGDRVASRHHAFAKRPLLEASLGSLGWAWDPGSIEIGTGIVTCTFAKPCDGLCSHHP